MKDIAELKLEARLRLALEEARRRLRARFDVDELVLFGSVARGTPDEESDVDLLVVLKRRPDLETQGEISRIILDINLEFDTNLSELVVGREDWDGGPISAMPIRREIQRVGFRL